MFEYSEAQKRRNELQTMTMDRLKHLWKDKGEEVVHHQAEFELIEQCFKERIQQEEEDFEREVELEVQGYKEWLSEQPIEVQREHFHKWQHGGMLKKAMS